MAESVCQPFFGIDRRFFFVVENGESTKTQKTEVKKLEFVDLVNLYLWIQKERPSHFAKRAGVDSSNFLNWRKNHERYLGPNTLARVRRAMLDRPVDRNHFAKDVGDFFEAFNEFEQTEGLEP